ncbi:peptidylprolyl isomerase [uncultured Winogradskyella sp.]|uniref:peptidylprolyl isomerase n=1 Tax=uncultured Winogradskyella sp. TaxID=395353 RepID=UPI003511099B
MKTIKLLLYVIFVVHFAHSQKTNRVLMTVSGDSISAAEFLRVYKKNLDLVQDESQKDVDGYLKLFTEYQLKLKEAKRLKLDEDKQYLREFQRYKKQLTQNYLSENKVTDALVAQAYDRSKTDINAAHILVRLDQTANDTLQSYNRLLELRDRVLKEGFDKVKADVHDGKTVFLEDLGYFSAFKMVYDFENAAYNTPVGEISMPFRTQFGYHVVIVKDKRPSRGTITAAHIMVAANQKDSTVVPEERIKEIYAKIEQGENFESLAKQFSDDKSSARNGGKLAPFKSGQLSSVVFEDQAFALQNDGDISKPFKTNYGWHIVKRINLEPSKPFNEVKPLLENRVKRDSRSKLINEAMVEELKKRYTITYNDKAKTEFQALITDAFFKRQWNVPESLDEDKVLFKINDRTFTYDQFAKHLLNAQRIYTNKETSPEALIDKEYNDFFEKSILKFREENLENENEDFANILKEYRDGLLLFDLMEKEVWNRAAEDTVGLKNFYEKNTGNYLWPTRIDMAMVSSADKSFVKKAQAMLKANKTKDEIANTLNTEDAQNIIFTNGIFPIDSEKLPKDFVAEKGVSKIYKHNDAFHVVHVKSILPEEEKTFEEAKGAVINDYQAQIEKEWIDALKSRFKVTVFDDVLNEVKSELKE